MERHLRLQLDGRGFVIIAIAATSVAMPVSVGSNRTKSRRCTRAVQWAEELLDRGSNVGWRHLRTRT